MVADILPSAAIGGLVGSVVAAIATIYQTRVQREAEDTRRRAEFHLEWKVETLLQLHSELEKAHRIYLKYEPRARHGDIEEEDRMELLETYQTLERASDVAGVFLTEYQYETVRQAVDEFQKANSFFLNVSEEYRRDELLNAYRKAEDALQREIKGPIDELTLDT